MGYLALLYAAGRGHQHLGIGAWHLGVLIVQA
jgi:hypothetical protein